MSFFLSDKENFAFINHVGVIIKVASSRCRHRAIEAQVTAVDTLPDERAEMDTVLPAGPYA